jgi:hypothetical protein
MYFTVPWFNLSFVTDAILQNNQARIRSRFFKAYPAGVVQGVEVHRADRGDLVVLGEQNNVVCIGGFAGSSLVPAFLVSLQNTGLD